MKKYKNIITLTTIFVLTIIGCIYALNWHSVYKKNLTNSTIITDYIHELKAEEFSNYIGDNPFAVVYFGVMGDDNCRRFENDFKKYILKNNLQETIVYINVSNLNNGNLGEQLDKIYNVKVLRNENKYLRDVPAVAVYNYAVLSDFVSDVNLTTSKVDKLLSKYDFNGE
jgi:hypothetical protein